MKQKENELLSRGILDELSQLKSRIVDLRRLQRSAPVWAKIAAAQSARAGVRKDTLISIINRHLMERTQRMLLQLGEIAENIQLIEVEIYNGATHDIIWQSAHPDYKKLAQKMSDDGASSENRAPSWNWGRMPASIDEEGEIWEDELGSFKANLYDNCTSKDRYLALKRGNSP